MNKRLFWFFVTVLWLLTACGSATAEKTENFTKEAEAKLKLQAKEYSEQQLQDGEVPLNDYIKLTGRIITSDVAKETIQTGDRFVLQSGNSRYQIFNEQSEPLELSDEVTVYGEYYGFIKANLIEKE